MSRVALEGLILNILTKLLEKNRHRENKRTQTTTQEYNVETPKPEKKITAVV
jgi:hypothetical protein